MKILQINSVCGVGSTGKITVQISDYLNENKIENYIAYGVGKSSRPNTFKIGNLLDARLHSLMSKKLCMQGYGSKINTLRLVSYIKGIEPDIVHLHNIHGQYLNFKILFSYLNKTNIKVVWTFHDCWPYTGKCTYYTEVGCYLWKNQCQKCPFLETYPASNRDRTKKNFTEKKEMFTGNSNLYIATVSKWLKDEVKQSYFKGKSVECIYNGINTEIFQYRENKIKNKLGIFDKFMILGVASVWNSRKGLEGFLEIASRIDDDSVVVLIGITTEQKRLLPDNVIGVEKTNNQIELAEFYSAADVFVNLSIEETFGLVVAEAMACGTPAVVYNSTACPEVPSDGSGFIVEPGNIDGVLECIQTVKIEGKEKYSGKAIKRMREKFSQQNMLDGYLNLYKKCMEQGESKDI